eukprot:s1487_g10.t1
MHATLPSCALWALPDQGHGLAFGLSFLVWLFQPLRSCSRASPYRGSIFGVKLALGVNLTLVVRCWITWKELRSAFPLGLLLLGCRRLLLLFGLRFRLCLALAPPLPRTCLRQRRWWRGWGTLLKRLRPGFVGREELSEELSEESEALKLPEDGGTSGELLNLLMPCLNCITKAKLPEAKEQELLQELCATAIQDGHLFASLLAAVLSPSGGVPGMKVSTLFQQLPPGLEVPTAAVELLLSLDCDLHELALTRLGETGLL